MVEKVGVELGRKKLKKIRPVEGWKRGDEGKDGDVDGDWGGGVVQAWKACGMEEGRTQSVYSLVFASEIARLGPGYTGDE